MLEPDPVCFVFLRSVRDDEQDKNHVTETQETTEREMDYVFTFLLHIVEFWLQKSSQT